MCVCSIPGARGVPGHPGSTGVPGATGLFRIGSFTLAMFFVLITRSSAIAEGPRDASCQLKSCQPPRNSAETTCTTSPVAN